MGSRIITKKDRCCLTTDYFIQRTICENIVYGRPDATLDEAVAAAKAAQAHDFILAMPQGYDSLVEERGANLSGGQKQRIAIARALLVSPKILILDDSTSAVDMETEAKIQAALNHLMDKSTTVMVAQRVSSVLTLTRFLCSIMARLLLKAPTDSCSKAVRFTGRFTNLKWVRVRR